MTGTQNESAARHEWIDALCARLEKIIIGREASDLLAQAPDRALSPVALVTLPVWMWLPPRVDIGRKAVRADGREMLMPVRLTWSPGPLLVLAAGQSATMTWHMTGLGHSQFAEVTLRHDGHRIEVTDGTLPAQLDLTGHLMGPGPLEVSLRELISRGRTARWDAIMSLEGYVEMAVTNAVTRVSADILDQDFVRGDFVLDRTALEQVRDTMLLGRVRETSTGDLLDDKGAVHRIIERCMRPGVFEKVDPLKYVVTDLYRQAEAEVRRHVDDPYIGRKIRRMQREMPGAPLTDVVAAYRQQYPGDDLSFKRAARALTSSRDAMAGAHDIQEPALNIGAAFDVEAIVMSRLEHDQRQVRRQAVSA